MFGCGANLRMSVYAVTTYTYTITEINQIVSWHVSGMKHITITKTMELHKAGTYGKYNNKVAFNNNYWG